MKFVQKANFDKKTAGVVTAGVFSLLLLFDVYAGFRWPGTWAMTSHIMDYTYGFIPRGFVGAVGHFLFRDYWYTSSLLLFSVMLAVTFLLFVYFLYNIWRLAAAEQKFSAALILGIFTVSAYPAFIIHESGYFEQYGYVLAAILIEISLRCKFSVVLAASAAFSFLAVLISETNAFMVCPILGSIVVFKLLEEKKIFEFKKLAVIAGSYIPTFLYCIIAGTYRMPVGKCEEMISYYSSREIDFALRTSAIYLLNNRTPESTFQYGTLKLFPLQSYFYPLLLIALTGIFLYYSAGKLQMFCYLIMTFISAVCSYILCITAWDFQRDMLGMMMAVIFLSLYWMQRVREDKIPKRIRILLIILVFVAMIGLYDFQIPVLDEGCYYKTLEQLKNDIWYGILR